jgi:hypothetical protein
MTRLFDPAGRAALFALAAILAAACQKPAATVEPPRPDTPAVAAQSTPPAPVAARSTGEDPEVVAHARKRGWQLGPDEWLQDGIPIAGLSVPASGVMLFGKASLTDDDYKMIARSKTVQLIDLRFVSCTEEGLKVMSKAPAVRGIILSGDRVTDKAMKTLGEWKSLELVGLFGETKVTDAGVKELVALPRLRSLHFTNLHLNGSCFGAFAGSKTLQSIVLQDVEGLTDDGVRRFADLPKLNRLEIGRGYTVEPIKAIVAKHLPAKFEFDKSLIDDELLQSLVAKGWLYGPGRPANQYPRLEKATDVREIHLSRSKVTDKGIAAVLDCTNTGELSLDSTGVTDETVKKLAAFRHLSFLWLGATKVNGSGLDALVGLPLRSIALQKCDLSEDAFKALGKMASLEGLWLSEAKFKPEWLKHLTDSPRSLRNLWLEECEMSEQGLEALGRIASLEELELSHTNTKPVWLQHLAGLSKLRSLSLTHTAFNDSSVKYVASLPNLEYLCLNETELGDAGFRELVGLPKIDRLLVSLTKVSRAACEKAKQDRPKLFVLEP